MEFHENIGLELSLNDEVAKKKVSQKDEDLQHHSPSPPPSPHKDPDPWTHGCELQDRVSVKREGVAVS